MSGDVIWQKMKSLLGLGLRPTVSALVEQHDAPNDVSPGVGRGLANPLPGRVLSGAVSPPSEESPRQVGVAGRPLGVRPDSFAGELLGIGIPAEIEQQVQPLAQALHRSITVASGTRPGRRTGR